jgi:hypothetical protein
VVGEEGMFRYVDSMMMHLRRALCVLEWDADA